MAVMADYNYNYREDGKSAGSGSFSSFGMRTQFEFSHMKVGVLR